MSDAKLQAMIREALSSNDPMLGYKAFLESQRQGIDPVDKNNESDILGDQLSQFENDLSSTIVIPTELNVDYVRGFAHYCMIRSDDLSIMTNLVDNEAIIGVRLILKHDGKNEWIQKFKRFSYPQDPGRPVPLDVQSRLLTIIMAALNMKKDLLTTMQELKKEEVSKKINYLVNAISLFQRKIVDYQKLCGNVYLQKLRDD